MDGGGDEEDMVCIEVSGSHERMIGMVKRFMLTKGGLRIAELTAMFAVCFWGIAMT